MDVLIFRSFVLLSAAILTCAIISEEPVNYEFCQCPCAKAEPLEVEVYFPTKLGCVIIRNDYSEGVLFAGDDLVGGKRLPYHDISHFHTGLPKRYPHSGYWKLYYPWKNATGKESLPKVIQNILNLEFLTWTPEAVPQSNREVIMSSKLTAEALWDNLEGTYGMWWKFVNTKSREFLQADEKDTQAWNEGKVYTDVLKRNDSMLYMNKFRWWTFGCYH